jgi:hypothetical protein
MREADKTRYQDTRILKKALDGKYRLDCGHYVTLNHNLGNNIMVINAKKKKGQSRLEIICSLCAY